jgi:hypothetical protein
MKLSRHTCTSVRCTSSLILHNQMDLRGAFLQKDVEEFKLTSEWIYTDHSSIRKKPNALYLFCTTTYKLPSILE